MTGKYHLIAATSTGLAGSVFYFISRDFSLPNLLDAGSLFIASSAAGLLPDIDLPKSTAGKTLKPISYVINKLFGHRTITHSGLWLLLLVFLLIKTDYSVFLIGTTIGYFSHLLADTMTAGGIPWIYPLSKKRISLTPVHSGHHDLIITIIASGFMIAGMFFIYGLKNELIQF